MALLAGIDEAGFGPLLGPLVVSGVAFRVRDDRMDHCLWKALRSTCSRKPSRSARRLAVADSKQLYKAGQSLGLLERAALVMLGLRAGRPLRMRELLDRVAPGATDEMDHYPWYAARDLDLPISDDAGDLGTRANAVRRDGDAQEVEWLGAFSEPLMEGRFNRMASSTRNKGAIVLSQALRVMDRMFRAAPDRLVRLCVDRLGGRLHYREALNDALPGCEMQILEESAERSVYRLTRPDRVFHIEFVTEGETHHFCIALASVYSKYIRELFMRLFNDYWCGQAEDLAPTAGYYNDALRWLRQAEPALARLAIDRRTLVRER